MVAVGNSISNWTLIEYVHKIPLLSGRGLFIGTNIITGHGFDGFKVPVYWGSPIRLSILYAKGGIY